MTGNSVMITAGTVSMKFEQGADGEILFKHYAGDTVTAQGKLKALGLFAHILYGGVSEFTMGGPVESADAVNDLAHETLAAQTDLTL